ncbi:hypothetical protein Tco_0674241 [Tanacetum coccineum]
MMQRLRNIQTKSVSGTLPCKDCIPNPKEDKKVTLPELELHPRPKAFKHEFRVTKDTMHPANNGSTEDVQPPVVQIQSRNPNPEPNVAPVVAAIFLNQQFHPPSRRNDERPRKANDPKREIR